MKKILLLTPWKWKPNYDWFRRDLGLLCAALINKGYSAHLIVIEDPRMPTDDSRLLGASPSDLRDARWWRSHHASLVVSIAGFMPAAVSIHKAIKNAEIPIWNKMDTDGVWGVSTNPLLAYQNCITHAKMRTWPSPLLAGTLLYLYRYISGGDLQGIKILELADKFLVESPLAVVRAQRFFLRNSRKDLAESVCWIPGPVPMDRVFSEHDRKEDKIIAVARWDDFAQKDTPKLIRVLRNFLHLRPNYSADIIGHHDDRLISSHSRLPSEIQNRIILHGRIPNEALSQHYKKAKICLSVSRVEGFPNVGAESLCCGCSVVGPSNLAAFHYFAGSASGTLAHGRSDSSLLDALLVEELEWRRRARNPVEISNHFRSELSAEAVAEKFLMEMN